MTLPAIQFTGFRLVPTRNTVFVRGSDSVPRDTNVIGVTYVIAQTNPNDGSSFAEGEVIGIVIGAAIGIVAIATIGALTALIWCCVVKNQVCVPAVNSHQSLMEDTMIGSPNE
jgi:hypothetical protein